MLEVNPSSYLKGTVKISGAKNAILPIIAASLLTKDTVLLNNVPFLKDVEVMEDILTDLGCVIINNREKDNIIIQAKNIQSLEGKYELANKMRASVLIMGPMLSRFGEAKIYMPGGCAIGSRPIDLHLKGFIQMGVNVEIEHGYVVARVPHGASLKGANIYMDFPSVGATENIMMAAVMAVGETIICNAAEEPEIVDLANFINSMGGKVEGAGTETIRVTGVDELHGSKYSVIPDRIEAGTFMIAAASRDSHVFIENIIPNHLKAQIAKLREIGTEIIVNDTSLEIIGNKIKRPIDIKTLPYPGFPTDIQAQFMSLLSVAKGTSIIKETVFENRFMHVEELNKMGCNIKTGGRIAIINGVNELQGARVKATDLRAGAALIIAGIGANGKTYIENEEHIYRGYYKLTEKFNAIGISINKIADIKPTIIEDIEKFNHEKVV